MDIVILIVFFIFLYKMGYSSEKTKRCEKKIIELEDRIKGLEGKIDNKA